MVKTKTHTGVGVKVWAQSTTYVATELIRVTQEVIQRRGLPMDFMHNNGELFVNSFRTWITGRYLKGLVIEVWSEESLRERYDLTLDYATSKNDEKFDTYIERLRDTLAQRPQLPEGCCYRVVVQLDQDAPPLPGWSETTLRDTTGLEKQNFGNIIGAPRHSVIMDCWF